MPRETIASTADVVILSQPRLTADAAYILRRRAGVFDAKASVRAWRASVFGDAGLGPPRKPI